MARYQNVGTKEKPVIEKVENLIITDLKSSQTLSESRIQALTERNEFLEDLIAELAVQVYSTPPNV